MTDIIEAKCDCGKVQFTTKKSPIVQVVCHCTDCRSATGNDFSEIAFFNTDDAEITGEVTEHLFESPAGNNTIRAACKECGTFMFNTSDGFEQIIGVFSDRLQPPFMPTPVCDMWTDSKVPGAKPASGRVNYPKGIN